MMLPSTAEDKRRLAVALCVLGVLVVATAFFASSGHLQLFVTKIAENLQHREEFRRYLQSWGPWAPLAFITVQAVQVVIAPIPGEFTGVIGGFLFGTFRATIYSTFGLTLGSAMAFLAARIVGLPLVKLIVKPETLGKLHFVTEFRGEIAALILFMIPGFPKDILSYLLGLSPMSFLTFLVVCGLGRIPGTLMLAYGGSAFYKAEWQSLGVLGLLCLLCFIAFYLKGESIKIWIRDKIHPHHDSNS
jgi:uncharacterized membrane protein YdjX (TVP38/TMEM64 family)